MPLAQLSTTARDFPSVEKCRNCPASTSLSLSRSEGVVQGELIPNATGTQEQWQQRQAQRLGMWALDSPRY